MDTSKFQVDPCSVLTSAQQQSLNLGQGKAGKGAGPSCDWHDTTSKHLGLTVTAVTGNGQGLSTLYQQKAEGSIEVLEPLPAIGGMPAVRYAAAQIESHTGCTIAVGVTDQLDYTIDADVSDKSDPCATTKPIAQMVVQTLKGGS